MTKISLSIFFLFSFFISLLGNSNQIFQVNIYQDSIDLNLHRTYQPEELDSIVKNYYQNLDIKDTFDLAGAIAKLTLGDKFKNVSFDSIISNFDWNEAINKIDWNAALGHIDFNEAAEMLCNMKGSIFENTPITYDFPTDSILQKNEGPSQENLMKCFNVDISPEKMMQVMDLPCLMNQMSDEFPDRSPLESMKSLMQGGASPDKELFCAMISCIDMELLFENLDFNCVFEFMDFNLLLKNWTMDEMLASYSKEKVSQGNEIFQREFKDNPLFKLINKDSVIHHIMVAYEDFFDPRAQGIMNKNFNDRTFALYNKLGDTTQMLELLELMTPLVPVFFGEHKHTSYILSAIWLFYDIQLAHSQLDYETAYMKQLLLKDIVIYTIENKLVDELEQLDLPSSLITDNMLWTLLATLDQQIGNSLSELGEYTKALAFFESSLSIIQTFDSKVDPVEVEALYFQTKFKDQEERLTLLKEYAIDTTVLQLSLDDLMYSKHPRVVERFIEKGEYEKALTAYYLLKDLLLETGKEHKVFQSHGLPNPMASKPYELIFLRLIHEKMKTVMDEGKLTENEEYQKLCAAPKAIDSYHNFLSVTFAYNNLGAYYIQLNDFELGLKHLKKAWDRIKYLEKIDYMVPAFPGYGTVEIAYLNKLSTFVGNAGNVASVYISLKEYDQATQFLHDAIFLIKNKESYVNHKIGDQDFVMTRDEYLFDLYAQLGRLYLINLDKEKAWQLLSKCDSIAQSSKFLMRPLLSKLYLGHYCFTTNQPDSALYHWSKAKNIAYTINNVNILSAINGLIGRTYDQKGEYKIASTYYDTCEAIASSRSQYSVLNYSYSLRGQHYLKQKEYSKALDYFEKSIAIIEDSLFFYTLSEGSRQLTLEQSFTAYEGAINTALEIGEADLAFKYLQQAKARTLNELLATSELNNDDIPLALRDEKQNVTIALNKVQQKLFTNSVPSNLRSQQKELSNQLKIVNAKIRNAIPEYADLLNLKLTSLLEVQRSLRPNQAFIEYFMGERLLAFVISKTEVEVIDLGNSNPIKEKLFSFKTNIDSIKSTKISDVLYRKKLQQKMYYTGQSLYPLLFEPIESSGILAGIEQLIIAPDDALYLLPFEILNKNQGGNLSYLTSNFLISYLQSATTFVNLQQTDKTIKNYSKDLQVITKSDFSEYPNLANLKTVDPFVFQSFSGQVDFLTDEAATLQSLEDIDLKDYRYIYISTHGKINPIPELSSLALTNSQLSLYNTFDLDLKNELVILSACETAKGTFQRGGGVMGFTRGLMHAGAESLIISLWSVDDEATEVFFALFFKHINEGQSAKAALQKTKLDFQESEKYKSPFYWAGFVLFGG